MKTNTCRVKKFYYTSKRVIKVNKNEVHSTLVRISKCEVYIILEIKEYVILIVVKSKLIQYSSEDKPNLIVVKCSETTIYLVSLR